MTKSPWRYLDDHHRKPPPVEIPAGTTVIRCPPAAQAPVRSGRRRGLGGGRASSQKAGRRWIHRREARLGGSSKKPSPFSALVLSGEARHETSTTRGAVSRHHCREWAHETGA